MAISAVIAHLVKDNRYGPYLRGGLLCGQKAVIPLIIIKSVFFPHNITIPLRSIGSIKCFAV
jgi:hypothetical protein